MKKIDILLVVLNREYLESAIRNLDFDKVNLATIVMDCDEKTFPVDGKQIPMNSFSNAPKLVKNYKEFTWLIVGYEKDLSEVLNMKKILMTLEVSEDKIINFEMTEQINPTWLANLRYVEEHGADFFMTGNEYTRDGLNLKLIPCVHANKEIAKGGVNLADAYQDLRQSYLTAKYVFEHVAPGTIKFVFIGLAPGSFHYDNTKDFLHGVKNLQYVSALNSEPNINDNLLKDLLSDDFKSIFATTSEQADLNFDAIKAYNNRNFSVKSVIDWKDDKKSLPTDAVESNVQILKDYIELCLANGAKPVGIILPFAPPVRKTFDTELLATFRKTIHQLEENYDFKCIDWFDHIILPHFSDMMHLNAEGSLYLNSSISAILNTWKIIPDESFCDMNYDYFYHLSSTMSKNDYNAMMERVFKASVQKIRSKDKIKVGFIVRGAAEWCGDDLYKFFAQNKRFETVVFDCLQLSKAKDELFRKDFQKGVEQLKSHGLNVVALDNKNAVVPVQDILISLTPYFKNLPVALRPENITLKTLLTHIPYAFDVSTFNLYGRLIFRTAWKVFFSSTITFDLYEKNSRVGIPRGYYSGYSRMDAFFKHDKNFHFDWKMVRPDAKKIIWAPHWSINDGVKFATFQWNYKLIYDFAKAHPETSWIVKPHPNLLYSAVKEKIFSSAKAFEEYLNAWNDLPNAQVYTGAYYQDVFATSDGMIQDCASFTAEYQYMNKPMIYLTRNTQKHNKLGEEILKASYLVDGKDLEGIAAILQKIFIEGKDDKAAERKKVFDKYLNYPKANGMLASEFIYKSIVDEFK